MIEDSTTVAESIALLVWRYALNLNAKRPRANRPQARWLLLSVQEADGKYFAVNPLAATANYSGPITKAHLSDLREMGSLNSVTVLLVNNYFGCI